MLRSTQRCFTTLLARWAVVLTLVLLPSFLSAQESNLGNWMIYIGNKKVNSNWNIHHEVQYRNYNGVGDLEQLLLRTGLGYQLSDNSNLLLGYGYILSKNYINQTEKQTVNEHRIFQQFITKDKVGPVNFQHRYRFEQRFVEEDFKLRFRYFLGLSTPLISKDDRKNLLYLSAYNEIFLNSKANVFDRNRVYAGLGHAFNKTFKVELGYMNQFLNGRSRDQLTIVLFSTF